MRIIQGESPLGHFPSPPPHERCPRLFSHPSLSFKQVVPKTFAHPALRAKGGGGTRRDEEEQTNEEGSQTHFSGGNE